MQGLVTPVRPSNVPRVPDTSVRSGSAHTPNSLTSHFLQFSALENQCGARRAATTTASFPSRSAAWLLSTSGFQSTLALPILLSGGRPFVLSHFSASNYQRWLIHNLLSERHSQGSNYVNPPYSWSGFFFSVVSSNGENHSSLYFFRLGNVSKSMSRDNARDMIELRVQLCS